MLTTLIYLGLLVFLAPYIMIGLGLILAAVIAAIYLPVVFIKEFIKALYNSLLGRTPTC